MSRRPKEVNVIIDAKNKARGAFLDVKKGLNEIGRESRKGASTFSRNFSKMDKVVLSLSDRLKFMDKIAKRTFQGTAAAAGLYIGTTLRDFTQLEDGISKVNTLYDQTGKSQQKMIEDSLKMYKLIPGNFQQITQGIYDTISAGGSPQYASMMARKFGMASVAGTTEMPVVTKAAMGTMNAFGKEVKDLNHILDVQFLTVKNGIVEYEQLASSLGTGVLKSAEGAGMTMEELYAAIAQITKNAIPANVATTSLVQLFNKFTDSNSIKKFKEMGVDIQDATGKTRDLYEILKDLNNEFDKRGMTKEQRSGYLKELLGSDEAARAIQPLLGDLKEFSRILGDMENSSGAMSNAFDDRLENISNQLKILWQNLKSYGVENLMAFEPLIDAITGPMMEKQKLELKKMDLEDYIKTEKDPKRKKEAMMEIEEIQKQINDIDFSPVEELSEGLDKSVQKLKELNPGLAKFADILGKITIALVGEEGKTTRDNLKAGGAILAFTYLSKKLFQFADSIGKFVGKDPNNPGETLVKTMRSMNVNANVVNVYGKSINSRGGNGFKGDSTMPGSNIGKSATDAVKRYLTYKALDGTIKKVGGKLGKKLLQDSGKKLLKDSGKKIIERQVVKQTGKKIISESAKRGAITLLDVSTKELLGAALGGVLPVIEAGVILAGERKKNKKRDSILENPNDYMYSFRKGEYVKKEDLKRIAFGNGTTVYGDEELLNRNRKDNVTIDQGGKKINDESRGNFIEQILDFPRLMEKMEKPPIKNDITIQPPKMNVRVIMDSKELPIKSIKTLYEGFSKQREINSRRY